MPEPGDVLTMDNLPGYLRISKFTHYKLVMECNIPCQKGRRHWRFHKEAVDGWLKNVKNTAKG